MSKSHENGFYVDSAGVLQPDRRKSTDDRRGSSRDGLDHDRRSNFRRRADREILETDHKVMIREALEDFAEEHDGHL